MNDILGLMMTATAVESSGVTCAKIHELMHGYKKKRDRRSSNFRIREGIC